MVTQSGVIQCGRARRYTVPIVEGDGSPAAKPNRTRAMSEQDRKAAGVRLGTARAAKFGLTLEQYRELHLRPGQTPTAEGIARVTAGRSKMKAEAERTVKGRRQVTK